MKKIIVEIEIPRRGDENIFSIDVLNEVIK